MTPVIGIGAGGHAKVILEILRDDPRYQLAGLLDRNRELWGKKVAGIPVLGGDELLKQIFAGGTHHAFIGVGTTGNGMLRQRLYETASRVGFEFVPAIHPKAIISPGATIGIGAAIMAGAIINVDVCLGDNVIINTGAVVEHDCSIGNHTHIATRAALAGGVKVGSGSLVGAGASVRQCVQIGNNAIVGAGAVVVKNVPDNVIVVGVPARFLKTVAP
jgi:sugar O-acyltransferase (sialic acid O-acetyltransferase NeuD family)